VSGFFSRKLALRLPEKPQRGRIALANYEATAEELGNKFHAWEDLLRTSRGEAHLHQGCRRDVPQTAEGGSCWGFNYRSASTGQ